MAPLTMLRPVVLVMGLAAVALGVPTPAPAAAPTPYHAPNAAIPAAPEPTPAQGINERGLGDDVKSYVKSLVSDVGSDVSSFVDSGILDFPNGFPTGTAVEKSLGVSRTDLDAKPTQVLNLP